MEIIPVINENDTVSFEEIMFGDNDNLAALVISLTEADLLVLLSDVEGFFDKDPAKDENAKLLSTIAEIDSRIESFAGDTFGKTTSGGMRTKIQAARSAAAFGVPTIIGNGKRKDSLLNIFNGQEYGTVILPTRERLTGKKHWIAYTLKPQGKLILDEGAAEAITKKGRSLLPSGIKEVEGEFGIGDLVSCFNSSAVEISRGLCSYGSSEVRKILGKKSSEIENVLGYRYSDEIIHRKRDGDTLQMSETRGFNRFSAGLAVFVFVLLTLSAWFYFLDGFPAETKNCRDTARLRPIIHSEEA